jgi:hypothetical protein
MKTIIKIELIFAILILLAFSLPSFGRHEINMDTEVQLMLIKQTPQPTAKMFAYSVFRTAPLEVAKVFGRTAGCSDADADMIQATAKAAIEANLDPAIAAATVGVESACNPFAVSSKGAVGIMQIMPKVWKDKYDFAGDVNLFNRDTNLSVGAHIEAELINQYGLEGGVRRYNGMGVGCDSCDAGYVSKILTLAGRR